MVTREARLGRAYAFLAHADMAGERSESSLVGTAVFDEAVPRRLDSNFLRVESEADAEARRSFLRKIGYKR